MGKFGHVVDRVDKQAYLSAYALAKYVVVTCDSISMISEAAASGKPIYVAQMKAKKDIYRFKKWQEGKNLLDTRMIVPPLAMMRSI